jgi:alkyl sulfatase BDS1-like metallo-beta-lactamase superfamily hydrolase
VVDQGLQRMSLSLVRATSTPMMLDFAAVRFNAQKAEGKSFSLNLKLTDMKENHLITVRNGVMIHEQVPEDMTADATVSMKRADMLETLIAGVPTTVKKATGAIRVEGRAGAYDELVGLIDPLQPNFPVVTP